MLSEIGKARGTRWGLCTSSVFMQRTVDKMCGWEDARLVQSAARAKRHADAAGKCATTEILRAEKVVEPSGRPI